MFFHMVQDFLDTTCSGMLIQEKSLQSSFSPESGLPV